MPGEDSASGANAIIRPMKSTVLHGDRPPDAVAAASGADLDGLSRERLLEAFRCMVRSRKVDDRESTLRDQSKVFFQISGAGHEAILVAAGMTLKAGYDWFHPYYRDRALALQLGVTPLDMLLASAG